MAVSVSAPTLAVPPAYGYVLLVFFFTLVVHHIFMALVISRARRKYGVKHPAMYAADDAPNAKEFNCIQRGHQNSLENLPQLLALLLVLGLRFPITSAVVGLLINIGRLVYFSGYGTGNPDNRTRGTMIWSPATLVYYGMAVRWGIELLRRTR